MQSLDRFGGDASVGVVFIVGIGRFIRGPSRKRFDLAQHLIGEVGLFASQLPSIGAGRFQVLDDLFFIVWNRERFWVAMIAVADVKDLAQRLGSIATMFGKVLRHRDRVGNDLAQLAAQPVEAR